MEGMFAHSSRPDADDPKKLIDEIIREKQRIKICSLSRTFDCHLLWAHYASGFDGVAVEVDLPDRSSQVKTVAYRGVFAGVSIEHIVNPAKTARKILASKYREWEYEREVRILHHGEWFPLKRPVQRVIAGHRMQPSLFRALQIVCHQKGIPFCKTGIGDEGIDADVVPWIDNI
jgi:hypothetical protein